MTVNARRFPHVCAGIEDGLQEVAGRHGQSSVYFTAEPKLALSTLEAVLASTTGP